MCERSNPGGRRVAAALTLLSVALCVAIVGSVVTPAQSGLIGGTVMARAPSAAIGGRAVRNAQAAPAGSWLERPLAGWNKAGAPLPKAALQAAARDRVLARCQLTLPTSTPPERALGAAGWVPFLNVDQQLRQGDVEIVDGMTGADGMCRPTGYNIFVFVGGRFAGTLSPGLMTSREDGSSGAVRMLGVDMIGAEFVRYTEKDALCCPSSRVTVRYRIDRSGAQPVVVPIDVRTTRQL